MKFATLAAGCLAAAVFTGAACAQSIGIGAGKQGSQNYATSAAMANFLSKELGLDAVHAGVTPARTQELWSDHPARGDFVTP